MVFALCSNDCTSKWIAELYFLRIDFLLTWCEQAHARALALASIFGIFMCLKTQLNCTCCHHFFVFAGYFGASSVAIAHKDLIGIGKCEINKTKRCEPFLVYCSDCMLFFSTNSQPFSFVLSIIIMVLVFALTHSSESAIWPPFRCKVINSTQKGMHS